MGSFERYKGKNQLTLPEFETFLHDLKFTDWKPSLVTLHHTWSPTLDQWHDVKSLDALQRFYQTSKTPPWHKGPHFYVSDKYWFVFNEPTKEGVHAILYNHDSWGIEVVHNGDLAPFSGDQAKLLYSGMSLIFKKLGLDPQKDLRFHREDYHAKKTCPGLKVAKHDVINGILGQAIVPAHPNNGSVPVHVSDQTIMGIQIDGITYAPLVPLAQGMGAMVDYKPGLKPYIAVRKGGVTVDLSGEIEIKDGHAWVAVRPIAEDLGYAVRWNQGVFVEKKV